MLADTVAKMSAQSLLQPFVTYTKRPATLFRAYERSNLRPDLVAGITVAVILLPQAIAFAIIAELPPQMGLYGAIIGAIVGALWGSSNQVHTGPTNAISLLVFGALTAVTDNPAELVIAAGMLAVMVGIFQLVLGLARLGVLVNFVSHSVIVGFASGAGILIGIRQLSALLGLQIEGESLLSLIVEAVLHITSAHLTTAALGIGTIVVIVVLRRINQKLPTALIGMVIASFFVYFFNLHEQGVAVIGQLPSSLPPFVQLPLLNFNLIARLSTGALAVGAIGLVETTAIARSVSAQTGQRLDSNQEFVGQGLANIFMGFFSGYPGAGSFSRTAVNFKAGARSPIAAIFSGIFVLVAMFTLAPLAAFLPRAALAAVLIVTAYGMIDRAEIKRIWTGDRGDGVIMTVTLLATLFLEIEFAVLLGIMISLTLYVIRTSMPRVLVVVPEDTYKHFLHQPEKEECPQVGFLEIFGDLYFGAVNHVEEFILNHLDKNQDQRFLVIRMHHVNHCDFSGIHMLENVVRLFRDRGGDVYFVRVVPQVRQLMETTGFDTHLGKENFIAGDDVVPHLFYHVLDPAICIYECPHRVFKECQNLPKRRDLLSLPLGNGHDETEVESITAQELWDKLHPAENEVVPKIYDVREPREFSRGRIPVAKPLPLSDIMNKQAQTPSDETQIVLVCRSGRRSRRAAHALFHEGCENVVVLQGGMLAWEAAGLIEAFD